MRPVIGLDIDGTLVDYHAHFLRFAEQWLGKDVEPDYYADIPMHKHIGVSKTMYRRCKLAYRRGEMKRSVPLLRAPYPNANELTHQLRRWGCDIWLCTTRPYLSHDAVDEATRHNLRRNGIVYQGLIWGEHKYRELVRTVDKASIIGVIDDLPEMCQQAENLGLPVSLAIRDHNGHQQWRADGSVVPWYPVRTHDDTLALCKRWLNDWRDK